MSFKSLLRLVVLLLAAVFLSRYIHCGKGAAFAAEIVTIDTAKVSTVVWSNDMRPGEDVLFKREGDAWIAVKGAISTKSLNTRLQEMLGQMTALKTAAIAAQDAAQWDRYGIGQDKAHHIQLYNGSVLIDEFYIGSRAEAGRSYLRLPHAPEVFLVESPLASWLEAGFNGFRTLRLAVPPLDDVQYMEVRDGADSLTGVYTRQRGVWCYSNVGYELAPDKLAAYFATLGSLQAKAFVDEFDPQSDQVRQVLRLQIVSPRSLQPFGLCCYRSGAHDGRLVVQSSLSPNTFVTLDTADFHHLSPMPQHLRAEIPEPAPAKKKSGTR